MPWYTKYLSVFEKPFSNISPDIIDGVKGKLQRLNSDQPLASVVVIAHNEETRLLSCLWSLSDMVCKYPIEIIGVNNNSIDKTGEVFEAVGITPYFEEKKSCGYARHRGLYNAKGKYYICIDSDTMYPPYYVETMVTELEKPDVAGVSGLLSLLPDKQHSRIGLAVYEFFRDIHIRTLFIKRPELGARGAAYAYRIEYGRKVGYRVDLIRGEDGSMILGLKNYGKIKLVTSRKARPITPASFSETDGSLFKRFLKLSTQSLKRLPIYFTKKEHYKDEESNLIK